MRLVEENRAPLQARPRFESPTPAFSTAAAISMSSPNTRKARRRIVIRITVANRGPERGSSTCCRRCGFATHGPGAARTRAATWKAAASGQRQPADVVAQHVRARATGSAVDVRIQGRRQAHASWLFTENETNNARAVRRGDEQPLGQGCVPRLRRFSRQARRREPRAGRHQSRAALISLHDAGRAQTVMQLRLRAVDEASRASPFGPGFRRRPSTERHARGRRLLRRRIGAGPQRRANVARQAYAGLLWSKQFYHYVVKDWLERRSRSSAAARSTVAGRNHDWPHLFNARHHFDARQMGVPLVRRMGYSFPHDSAIPI